MDKQKTGKISRRQTRRPAGRRLVQLYAALLHNAYLRGFIEGKIYEGKAKALCVPGLNCYSCPGAAGSCPLGAIQNALSSAGHRPGWYVLGIILLFGVVLGRTVCGWLCPVGLLQELLHRIPTLKIRKSRVTWALTRMKYVILAVFVIALPLYFGLEKGLPYPAFCKFICPAGTLEGAAGLLAHPENASMFEMLGILFTCKWVILLGIVLACIFCYRSFCRFICPLGAVYSLFRRFSITGVRVDADRCSGCGACVHSCEMDVRQVGDRECIHCGKCMDACVQGAISVKAGKFTLLAPETGCAGDPPDAPARRRRTGRILRGVALAGLCFALIWFNFLDPSLREKEQPAVPAAAGTEVAGTSVGADASPVPESPETQQAAPDGENRKSDAPVGFEAGQQPADFTVTCYDGSEFRLADTRGRITFINRWATWCTPCIEELPYFNALYQAHEGDIAMLVLHPSLTVEDPETFLADFGLAMPCATDADGDPVKEILGGTAALPQTVVLNRLGEVIYNRVGSVTPDMLETLYREAAE